MTYNNVAAETAYRLGKVRGLAIARLPVVDILDAGLGICPVPSEVRAHWREGFWAGIRAARLADRAIH